MKLISICQTFNQSNIYNVRIQIFLLRFNPDILWNLILFADETPLIAAIQNGHTNIVNILIENRANVNHKDILFPKYFIQFYHFYSSYFTPDEFMEFNLVIYKTPLIYASGNVEIIKILLRVKGIQVNEPEISP